MSKSTWVKWRVRLLFTAGQKYARVGSVPISSYKVREIIHSNSNAANKSDMISANLLGEFVRKLRSQNAAWSYLGKVSENLTSNMKQSSLIWNIDSSQ